MTVSGIVKDESYYLIQGFMINKLGLKGVPLSVYAIIYGFSQDGYSEFTGSLQYLCDFTGGTSKPTVIKALQGLVEKGYIYRREEFVNGVKFNRYRVNLALLNGGSKEILPPVKKFNGGSKENTPEVVKKFNGGVKETLPNNIDNNISFNNKEYIKNIVDFLNFMAGTNYRASGTAIQRHINARLAEGYTVQDFQTVIEKKCNEWMNTDMQKYLRPETLFGSKFDTYLNAPIMQTPKPVTMGVNGIAIKSGASDLDTVF